MKRLIMLGAALAMAGCVNAKPVKLTTTFDAKQAAYVLESGKNTVSGQGFMRQQGGGVVTCAGSAVGLIPVTGYSTERVLARYGNTEKGFQSVYSIAKLPDDAEYQRYQKQTKCDAQGNFVFEHVADGDYYVTTMIVWMVGYARDGGIMMQHIAVKGGDEAKVLLTY